MGCFTDDDTKDKAPSFYKWVEHLKEASAKFGRPMGIAQNMRKWMEEAGFEDVYEEIRKVCFSPLSLALLSKQRLRRRICCYAVPAARN